MTDLAPAAVDYADIQGDILRAYGKSYDRTSYMLVHIERAPGGRTWVGSLLEQVTNAETWPEGWQPDTTLNVALTYTGLQALGVSESALSGFSEEFKQGMAGRAETLGDVGESSPTRWEDPFGTGRVHALITINAKTTELLEATLKGFRARVEEADGVSIINEQHAQLLEESREHFGYEDGFAQPAIAGVTDRTLGNGVPEPAGKWRGLALGEFILGYEDEDSPARGKNLLPSAPDEPLGRSGTYMVYRKLSQNVALFRKTVRDGARLYEGGEAKLLAKIVGRWPNGTPLVSSPDAPDPNFGPEDLSRNAFRYLEVDEKGLRCPLGAHIRRANPRDALGWKELEQSGLLSYRHRIIRRGMPYGPPLPPDASDTELAEDRVDRGLMFVCFNASISRQFEGIQTQWINDGNAFGLGHDKDYLLGDSHTTDKLTVQGSPPFFLSPQPSFVTMRGGEYLFVPGLAALRALASGAVGSAA
jgi:Dyp-type peroxidase family